MAKRSKRHECKCSRCGMVFTAPTPMDRCGECGYLEMMARLATTAAGTLAAGRLPAPAPAFLRAA